MVTKITLQNVWTILTLEYAGQVCNIPRLYQVFVYTYLYDFIDGQVPS